MTWSFREATIGRVLPHWTVGPFTRTDFVRYQGASGDMNPVHHDEIFAKKSGFQAPLGIGMYTAGLMNTFACRLLGAERCTKTKMRWKRPVFPGAVVTFHGSVTARDEAAQTVDVELSGEDADGHVLVQGWMTFDYSADA